MSNLASAVLHIASDQQDDCQSFITRQTHLGRAQVQLPTPKFNTSFQHQAVKQDTVGRSKASHAALEPTVAEGHQHFNLDFELLFDAGSYLNSFTPTRLASRTPIDLLKEPMCFKVLNLGPFFLMPLLSSEEILKEFPSRVIFWYV